MHIAYVTRTVAPQAASLDSPDAPLHPGHGPEEALAPARGILVGLLLGGGCWVGIIAALRWML